MATANVPSVSKSDIRSALKEILQSPSFVDSPQLRDFLSFIVEKTIEGKQNELKAYTIAVDALGRAEDFDPQSNAAVRVAAGRLRQALATYYESEAAENLPVRIVLAPGSYIPSFEKVGEQHA